MSGRRPVAARGGRGRFRWLGGFRGTRMETSATTGGMEEALGLAEEQAHVAIGTLQDLNVAGLESEPCGGLRDGGNGCGGHQRESIVLAQMLHQGGCRFYDEKPLPLAHAIGVRPLAAFGVEDLVARGRALPAVGRFQKAFLKISAGSFWIEVGGSAAGLGSDLTDGGTFPGEAM